jgi:hypothetical protein|tara:strand:- start:1063 stop:1188 length:126 start_codon:yes stop_codon:yes gene_type:complete
MTPSPRDVALFGVVYALLLLYTLLGAAGFWEPLPVVPLIPF